MLAGHGARSTTADVSALADHNQRPSSNEEELLAERFAAVVLRRARRAPPSASVLERRSGVISLPRFSCRKTPVRRLMASGSGSWRS